MIQSFKQRHDVKKHYDAILIGSGMGCLAAAACLAKAGKDVLVLERHYTAGGYTHVFKRRGYEWDVGIHYIGEVNRDGILKRMFDYVTDGELTWADMGEVYDRICIGDNIYDFPKGVGNFKDQMKAYFPGEEQAIDKYVDMVFEASKASRSYYSQKALPRFLQALIGKRLRTPYMAFAGRTTLSMLKDLTDNELLIKVLTAQYGDYGLPPAKSSFAMHASVVKHYFKGASFPIGGSARIAETVDKVLEQHGSTILTNAEVDQVVIEKGKATGVQMADGQVFSADAIISGTGIFNTYTKLLPEQIAQKHKFPSQLAKVQPSFAHACLYIGLHGSPEELNLPKANYWIYPEDLDHDASVDRFVKDSSSPFPVVYISFPAAKDPSWPERYPGKSTIDIITVMPYDMVEKWQNSRWKKRGDEYEAFKADFSERLLEALFAKEPQLRGKVDVHELSSPITTRHFMNYDRGELYGIDHTPERFDQRFLQPRTPIKNFFLTGQDIVTAGVGGALFAGFLTASAVLKKNVVKELMK